MREVAGEETLSKERIPVEWGWGQLVRGMQGVRVGKYTACF